MHRTMPLPYFFSLAIPDIACSGFAHREAEGVEVGGENRDIAFEIFDQFLRLPQGGEAERGAVGRQLPNGQR